MEYSRTIAKLKKELDKALNSNLMTYEEVKKIKEHGIYILYKDDKIVYVGKTDRHCKIRLRELTSDYRSHTVNRKLMKLLLSEYLKITIPRLTNKAKSQLISDELISEENFLILQRDINRMLKVEYQFKFHSVESDRLVQLEHFAIAVLKPELND